MHQTILLNMILKIRDFCKYLCKEITIMYIAMNRFKIVLGREIEFENIWRQRDTHLKDVPGFEKFNLIKGKKTDSFILYASHSVWNSEEDFINWTKSDAFRKAHSGAGKHNDIYLGHPEFEGFNVIL